MGTHTGRKWLLGEAIPTQEKLIVLAAMLGVQPDWLRYGDHNSLSAKRASADFVSSVAAAPYNRHELALINNYKKLAARDQRLLRVLVSEMLRADS